MLFTSLVLSGAFLGGATAQIIPDVFFNLTLPADSPYLKYDLNSGRTNATGWYLEYLDATSSNGTGTAGAAQPRVSAFYDDSKYVLGNRSNPTSPSMLIEYPGYGFYAHGSFDGDNSGKGRLNSQMAPLGSRLTEGGILYEPDPLSGDVVTGTGVSGYFDSQSARLSVANGTLVLTSVSLVVGMATDAPSFDDLEVSTVPFVMDDNTRNPAFTYFENNSTWSVSQMIRGIDGRPDIQYKTLDSGARESGGVLADVPPTVLVPIPANTSFVIVNGTIGPTRGQLYRSLISGFSMANRTRVLTYPIRLNLSSTYEAPAMIFYAPLDPTRLYNLTLSPDTLSASSIALHSLTYYSGLWNGTSQATSNGTTSDQTTTQSTKVGAGAIAGGVVGGVVGLLLLGGLAFWLFRTRSTEGKEDKQWAVDPALEEYQKPLSGSLSSVGQGHPGTRQAPVGSHTSLPQDTVPPTTDSGTAVSPTSETATSSTKAPRQLPPIPHATPPAGAPNNNVELLPPTYKPEWSGGR